MLDEYTFTERLSFRNAGCVTFCKISGNRNTGDVYYC